MGGARPQNWHESLGPCLQLPAHVVRLPHTWAASSLRAGRGQEDEACLGRQRGGGASHPSSYCHSNLLLGCSSAATQKAIG